MSVLYQEAKIYGLTDYGKKIQIGKFCDKDDSAFYVGGKIFKIVDGDNGATYTFYDQYGNTISDVQVGDTPYAYKVSGTPSADKYYVFHNQAYTSKTWTYKDADTQSWVYESNETTDGIGKGKTNTNIMMAKSNYVNYNNTVWNTLQSIRDNSLGNCTDWFVPSKAEIEALRTATDRNGNSLTNMFINNRIWSSFEHDASYDWYFDYSVQSWSINNKGNVGSVVVGRAF